MQVVNLDCYIIAQVSNFYTESNAKAGKINQGVRRMSRRLAFSVIGQRLSTAC